MFLKFGIQDFRGNEQRDSGLQLGMGCRIWPFYSVSHGKQDPGSPVSKNVQWNLVVTFLDNVVIMVERNRRNKLRANFWVIKDLKISAHISSGNLYSTEKRHFSEVRGLKKLWLGSGWAKTVVRITGLGGNFGRDGGIEEPYWGPTFYTEA